MSKHVQHVRSNQTLEDGSPKLPTSETLLWGEIAVNYAPGKEALSIKNADSEVVTFGNEVVIGTEEPVQGSLAEIFIDESVDPITVEIYSQAQIDAKVAALEATDEELASDIDSKVSRGSEETLVPSQILVDESASDSIEVYTKQQVNDLFLKLKQLNPSLVWE